MRRNRSPSVSQASVPAHPGFHPLHPGKKSEKEMVNKGTQTTCSARTLSWQHARPERKQRRQPQQPGNQIRRTTKTPTRRKPRDHRMNVEDTKSATQPSQLPPLAETANGKAQPRPRIMFIHADDPRYPQIIKDVGNKLLRTRMNDPNCQLKKPSYPLGQPLPYREVNGVYEPTTPEVSFPIFKSSSGPAYLTSEIHELLRSQCSSCGERFCSGADIRCIYYGLAESWTWCTRCIRGFHTSAQCLAGKPITARAKQADPPPR